MEGERILQKILKGECRQLQDLKNYTAPFEKFLGGESSKYTAKKAIENEKISKYGAFYIKLLRYCVEAFYKKKENEGPIQEDCFKCAVLGADMLSKLITSGIVLPPEISISTIIKLFYHLIINALKENCLSYLLPITYALVEITQMVMKSGKDNIIKESTGLCKQLSNHLWNAAIKLPKTMDKLKRNLLALSLREKSIDLLSVAKQDIDVIIERGLLAGKQFQLEVGGSPERQEGKIFLLSILSNVVSLLDSRLHASVQLFSKLEDLCINCCELSNTPSHIQELLKSFNCLVTKETKNSASPQRRFSVFQCNIQILLCALSFRLKSENQLDNHRYDLNLKWNAVQKRLASTTEALENLDSNLYMESRIHLAMDYLRCILSAIFRTSEKTSNHLVKIPAEVFSALYDLMFVCHSIQDHFAKRTDDQYISNANTWKMVVQPKLAMLYLISTVLQKTMNSGTEKSLHYSRKNGVKRDYVAIMIEGMKTIDDVIEEIPAAIDQYLHYACVAFNTGLMLLNCSQVNDATSLARLSCEAGSKWYFAHSDESNAISKVKLHNKYELLSDCLKKQSHWLESLRTMGLCFQYYMLSIDDQVDEKALDYVLKWSNRKHNAIKELNDKRDVRKIQRCNLDDNCRDFNGPSLKDEQVCAFLKMELECYKKKRYCMPFDQLCVVEKLFNLYMGLDDKTNAFLMRLEKVKVMYHMAVQLDDGSSSVSDGLLFCEDLIRDINEMLRKQPESFKVKDILASAYFWSFILRYSIAVQQTKEDIMECTNDVCKEENILTTGVAASLEKTQLSMTPDFLHALNLAVNGWTELITGVKRNTKQLAVYSESETCWMLQIASSVYGFLNLTLNRIHTLLVLATFATLCGDDESLETVVVSNSLAIQAFCDEGNTPAAELLRNRSEEILSRLGDHCRPSTRYSFSLAKSQLFLCKGLHDEGWQLVQGILNEAKENSGTTMQFLLLKAKLLCVRYLSLPISLCKGADDSNYFDYLSESTKYVDALVKHFIENGADIEFAGLNEPKKERAFYLSHWSLLRELSCCYAQIGKVYLLQGSLREAKRFLEDGREITKRYLSAKRFSLFALELAALYTVWDMGEMCKAYLEDAINVVKPNMSLSDILDKIVIFDEENLSDDSVFGRYENISYALLYIKLCHCCCQYLKLNGDGSAVKKAISLSRDVRQNSVKLYRRALESQERMFVVAFGIDCDDSIGEIPYPKGKRNTKVKGKCGKATTKQNGKETTELISGKADSASLVFVESCLRTHALDADNALMERDYSRLLSTVQAGLDMVLWAQGIVSDPFLLDLMSTSLLHYLHGVARVLASSEGFDSWGVVGGAPSPVTNVAKISEVTLPLDLSVTAQKPSRKSRRGVTDGKKECFDISFGDTLAERRGRANMQSHPTSTDSKTKRKGRGGRKLTTEPSSVARSSRTPASRKVLSSIPQTPLASEKDIDDVTTERGPKSTKKHSRSSRKNTKEAFSKSSIKSKENCERNILFDISEPQREEHKEREREGINKISTKSPRDFSEECDQTEEELHQRKGMEYLLEKDKDMENAVDSFNSSLLYLHPCYNSILLTRICHALIFCHGSKSPEKVAVYQNMAMATTLHHQTLNRSTKKIRKEKEKQTIDRNESNQEDELVALLESVTLDNNEKRSIKQLLQLQTIKKTVAFTKSAGDALECFRNTIDLLPEDLTVCTLSIVQAPDKENVKHLVITRLRKSNESLALKLALPSEDDEDDLMEKEFQTNDSVVRDLSSIFGRNILSDFAVIMQELNEIEEFRSKRREWVSKRMQLNNRLEKFVQRMEEIWFGRWRGILNGRRLDEVDCSRLRTYVEKIQQMAIKILGRRIQNEQLLEVLTDSFCHLQANQVIRALADLTGFKENCEQLFKFSKALANFLDDNERNDNATSLRRGPIVLVLDKTIQHLPFESMPILREQEVSRMPSLQFINAHLAMQKMMSSGVDTKKTFYLLNPQDNLPNAEKWFSQWFSSEKGWKGVVGRAPSSGEFKEGLANNQIFIYVGHGNGREFLNGDEITRLYCEAVALIMGCSSGKLIVKGQCDARGMALNYLMSGSPAVVGNLWDVTDVDINKFTENVLRLWFKKTHKLSLTRCIVQSRNVCDMKYVNGGAPIVYGMPVFTRNVNE